MSEDLPAPVALLLEKEPVTHFMVSWMNLSASPDDLEQIKTVVSFKIIQFSTVHPLANSLYQLGCPSFTVCSFALGTA